MIQSGRRRFLLLDPLRMMRSGASRRISPDNVLVLLWPLLLVFPRMIPSRTLHGLVAACLHHHGLVWVTASLHHHGPPLLLLHCFSLASFSWLLLRITTASFAGLHHCITTALSSSCLLCLFFASFSSPLLYCTTALISWLLLCITAASIIGLSLRFTTVPSSSLLHCVPSTPSSSRFLCISMALSVALLPDMTASLLHLGLGLLFPSTLAATFPWTLQPRGRGLALLVPPRVILPGAARHFSPDDPALGVVSTQSCSAPDDQIRGILCHLSLDVPVGGRQLLLLDPPRMFQSAASAAACPRMIQSGGWRVLVLDLPCMFPSGALVLFQQRRAIAADRKKNTKKMTHRRGK